MITRVHIGPFVLVRLGTSLTILHISGEGGLMSLDAFEAEVCPWSEVERADEEKVRRFYAKWF